MRGRDALGGPRPTGFSHAPTLVHTRMQKKNKMAELQNPDLPAAFAPRCMELDPHAYSPRRGPVRRTSPHRDHANELKIAFESQSKDRNALRLPFRAFGFVMSPPPPPPCALDFSISKPKRFAIVRWKKRLDDSSALPRCAILAASSRHVCSAE